MHIPIDAQESKHVLQVSRHKQEIDTAKSQLRYHEEYVYDIPETIDERSSVPTFIT